MELESCYEKLLKKYNVSMEIQKKWWKLIKDNYSQDGRCYHNLNHLHDLYQIYFEYSEKVNNIIIEFSIFFHDVIYVPGRSDNEKKSAENKSDKEEISKIILCTANHLEKAKGHLDNSDLLYFCDFDFCILSSPKKNCYGDEEFYTKRRKFISFLLKEKKLYFKLPLEYEKRARENLQMEFEKINDILKGLKTNFEKLKEIFDELLEKRNLTFFVETHLILKNNLIVDLRGIDKYFPKLTFLDISKNPNLLKNEKIPMELSFCKALRDLNCNEEELTFISTQKLLQCVNLHRINGVSLRGKNHKETYLVQCREVLFQYYNTLKKFLDKYSLEEDIHIIDEFDNSYQLIVHECEGDFLNHGKKIHREIIIFGKYQIYHHFCISLLKILKKEPKKNKYEILTIKMLMKPQQHVFHEFISSSYFYSREKFKENKEYKESATRSKFHRVYSQVPAGFELECEEKEKNLTVSQMPKKVVSLKPKYRPRFEVEYRNIEKKNIFQKLFAIILMFFPFLEWIPKYKLSYILKDLFAGITVGIMCVPQSMAYSLIAGLPPVYGLYASLFPAIPYIIFGSSKVSSVGASALQALIVVSTFEEMQIHGEWDRIVCSMIMCLFSGVIQLLLGFFRAGFLVNFLSHSVISGFTSAGAILIALSQFGNFLGFDSHSESHVAHHIVYDTIMHLYQLFQTWPTVLLSVCFCLYLWLFSNIKIPITKKDRRIRIPGTRMRIKFPKFTLETKNLPYMLILIISVICILNAVVYFFPEYQEEGKVFQIKILGEIEGGFPVPFFPFFSLEETKLDFSLIFGLLVRSVAVSLVGFLEHISIAKTCANKNNPSYSVNSSQELLGIGLSCLVGGFFRAMPASGCLGRTALAFACGAKSQFYNFVVFIVILLTVSFFTSLFYYLPLNLLSAMIIMTVSHLIDIKTMVFCFKTKKTDFILLLISFFCTIFVGVAEGIIVAAGLSLVLIIYKSSRPRMLLLGRIPGTVEYRCVNEFPEAIQRPGVLILNFGYGLYFANIGFFKDKINKYIREYERECFVLILSFSSVNFIDANAVLGLIDILKEAKENKTRVFITNIRKNVYNTLKASGMIDILGEKNVFLDEHRAAVKADLVVRERLLGKDVKIKKSKLKKVRSANDLIEFKKIETIFKKDNSFREEKSSLDFATFNDLSKSLSKKTHRRVKSVNFKMNLNIDEKEKLKPFESESEMDSETVETKTSESDETGFETEDGNETEESEIEYETEGTTDESVFSDT